MLTTPTSLAITLSAPHALVSSAWEENTSIRFATSGLLGNVIFYGLDRAFLPLILRASQRQCFIKVSKIISSNAESISFFVAYLVDILVQHFLNALLVFGLETIETKQMYISSLAATYTAYFGTLCGSTIIQTYLLRLGVSKTIAFWSTIALGSVVNYLVLTALAARSKSCATANDDKNKRLDIAMVNTPKYFAFLGQSRLIPKPKSSD